jgi:hypothetical protein
MHMGRVEPVRQRQDVAQLAGAQQDLEFAVGQRVAPRVAQSPERQRHQQHQQ